MAYGKFVPCTGDDCHDAAKWNPRSGNRLWDAIMRFCHCGSGSAGIWQAPWEPPPVRGDAAKYHSGAERGKSARVLVWNILSGQHPCAGKGEGQDSEWADSPAAGSHRILFYVGPSD